MSNKTTGTAANVIVGPARLLVAAIGTALPTLTGDAPVWLPAWKESGYTADGLVMTYTPTYKEIMVDEEMAAVDEILDKETASLSAKLAEATLDNLSLAISASTLTPTAPGVANVGLSTLEVGSGSAVEVMVAFEGLSPKGFWRVFIGYRAKAKANISLAFKRNDKLVIPVDFTLLADSSKAVGKRLFMYADKTAAKTP